MLALSYSGPARVSFAEKHGGPDDQDDVLYMKALDLCGPPQARPDIQEFSNGLIRDYSQCSLGIYIWRANTLEAELWLMVNAPEGYEVLP